MCLMYMFFFFKQKTAYEMRISDWSSDVCSSELTAINDLVEARITDPSVDFMRDTEEFLLLKEWISSPDLSAPKKRDVLNQIFGEEVFGKNATQELGRWTGFVDWSGQIGRASCRERVCQYV